MARTAIVVTSEFSLGAAAFYRALERAGYSVSRATLEGVASQQLQADLYVDRSLPPYDLPLCDWSGVWFNRPDRTWNAWSKCFTAQVSQANGLHHPRSVMFESLTDTDRDPDSQYVDAPERAEAVLDFLGGRAVVKPDRGMMGNGLRLVRTVEEYLEATAELRVGVAQEYIESASTTLRILCTRTRAIAVFARVAAPGDWRANMAQGAHIEQLETSAFPEEVELALHAVRALRLDVAGVDIVQTEQGPIFLEANPSFGVGSASRQVVTEGSLDALVAELSRPICPCGDGSPHDAWAC